MNGPEAFRAVREIRPDARVIMASGCTELDVSRRLSIEGVVGFLQKPYDPMALIQMLRETLES